MSDQDQAPERPHHQFQPGNQLWKRASFEGVFKKKFENPEDFFKACCAYFEWLEDSPLYEAKAFSYEGDVTIENLPKMRAGTLKGLCLHIGIASPTWREWRNPDDPKHRADLAPIMRWAEDVLYEQKYTGAAAGLLNPAIVMRDLGLVDRASIEGPGGGPVRTITSDMTPQEAAEAYRAMISGAEPEQQA